MLGTIYESYTCEISLPLAKGQSAPDYVLAMDDYNKMLFYAQ